MLSAWTADPNSPIIIKNLPFEDGVSYEVQARLIALNNPRNLLPDDKTLHAHFIFIPANQGDFSGQVMLVPEFPVGMLALAASMAAFMGSRMLRRFGNPIS
jgi:hypothetical protein